MTDADEARRAALMSVMEDAAECIPEPPVRKLVSETTEMGGVVRLEHWPGDGYVLWYHGQIVWKSWEQPE